MSRLLQLDTSVFARSAFLDLPLCSGSPSVSFLGVSTAPLCIARPEMLRDDYLPTFFDIPPRLRGIVRSPVLREFRWKDRGRSIENVEPWRDVARK